MKIKLIAMEKFLRMLYLKMMKFLMQSKLKEASLKRLQLEILIEVCVRESRAKSLKNMVIKVLMAI